MQLLGESSVAILGSSNEEQGPNIATLEPPQTAHLINQIAEQTGTLPPFNVAPTLDAAPSFDTTLDPNSRLEPYFRSLEQHTSPAQEVVIEAAPPLPPVPQIATRQEMDQVARLVSFRFDQIPVYVIPIDKDHLELGYHLQICIFVKDPWTTEIPKGLQDLKGFELLLYDHEDFFKQNQPSFRINIDDFIGPSYLTNISIRSYEGVFRYAEPLNGPWV